MPSISILEDWTFIQQVLNERYSLDLGKSQNRNRLDIYSYGSVISCAKLCSRSNVFFGVARVIRGAASFCFISGYRNKVSFQNHVVHRCRWVVLSQ